MSTIMQRLRTGLPTGIQTFWLDPEWAQEHYQYDNVEVQLNWDRATLRLSGFNNSTIYYDEFDNKKQMNSAVQEMYTHRKKSA